MSQKEVEKRITIQSMIDCRTRDLAKTVAQAKALFDAGCSAVRISTPEREDIDALKEIRQELRAAGYHQMLIADIHFNPGLAVMACEIVDKVRINPGNFLSKADLKKPALARKKIILKKLIPLVSKCKRHNTQLRIGINQGSVYGRDRVLESPAEMAEAALIYLKILHSLDFHQVTVSLKSSNPWTVIEANILLKNELHEKHKDVRFHLGVTEAGNNLEGRVKSAIGIGLMLCHDIGDTIRVSLTEHPLMEIPVARAIIQVVKEQKKSLNEILSLAERISHLSEKVFNRVVLIHQSWDQSDDRNSGWKGDFKILPGSGEIIHMKAKEDLKGRGRISSDFGDLIKEDNFWNFMKYNQVEASFSQLEQCRKSGIKICLVVSLDEIPQLLRRYEISDFRLPIVCVSEISEKSDKQICQTAILMASLIKNQVIQGVWAITENMEDAEWHADLLREIFQVAGVGQFKSSVISCPGCSRMEIDLQAMVNQVKESLPETNKLKFSLMGCSVNGHGEMLNSDFGLIGKRNQRVDLFRKNELISRDVPADKAAELLLKMVTDEKRRFS